MRYSKRTPSAWGSAISLGKDQMDLVADVPIVDALILRALELDGPWDGGSLTEFMIAFESRGDGQGGSLERARQLKSLGGALFLEDRR